MSTINLVVQADDFGMCHAVNAGIERAFREGIVTQAVAMAPCGWLAEAAEIAKRSSMPIGMHCTLTSEWDHLRWGPITDGPSLVGEDGTFHRTVPDAITKIDANEAGHELVAQASRLDELGLSPAFFDCHMGPTCVTAFAHVCAERGRPFVYPLAQPSYALTSFQMLSPRSLTDKKAWMLEYVAALEPGTHFLCTHPGEPGAELAGLTRKDADNYAWAETFRASDLAVLIDPEIADAIAARDIALVSLDALDPPSV